MVVLWYIITLSHMTMASVSHVEETKKDLVKDVHRLAQLCDRLEDSPNGDFMAHHNSNRLWWLR